MPSLTRVSLKAMRSLACVSTGAGRYVALAVSASVGVAFSVGYVWRLEPSVTAGSALSVGHVNVGASPSVTVGYPV